MANPAKGEKPGERGRTAEADRIPAGTEVAAPAAAEEAEGKVRPVT